MPLYVRDEDVNQLAEHVRKAIGASTKTEAVRVALDRLLREVEQTTPLSERLKKYQFDAETRAKAPKDFDEKAFTDDMWGQ